MTAVSHVTPAESTADRYARHTRNAVVFIAVIVGIIAALALVGMILMGIDLSHVANAVNPSSGANCTNVDGIGC